MPSKTQTRRSISIKGTTYLRLKAHCSKVGIAKSRYLERLIADALDAVDALDSLGTLPSAVETRDRDPMP